MNNHNDQEDIIDQSIREAHGQIQFRDEWAERVFRRLASEIDQQRALAKSSVSQSQPGSLLSRWLGRRTLALAATIGLAAIGAYWLVWNPQRPDASNSMDSEIANRLTEPSDEPSEMRGDSELGEDTEPSTQGLQQIDTVTATPGYLAAKLTDDPEYEIYMVLPQTSVSKF